MLKIDSIRCDVWNILIKFSPFYNKQCFYIFSKIPIPLVDFFNRFSFNLDLKIYFFMQSTFFLFLFFIYTRFTSQLSNLLIKFFLFYSLIGLYIFLCYYFSYITFCVNFNLLCLSILNNFLYISVNIFYSIVSSSLLYSYKILY